MDRERKILQGIRLQVTVIGQGPNGFIQAAFQRLVALAKTNADTTAEVLFLVNLRADKFVSRAVFLAQKPEVGFHRIGPRPLPSGHGPHR